MRATTAALPGDSDEVTLVIRATGLLHAYGTPAHRLERVVVNLAESRGLSVEVFSTPTSILLGFGAEVEDRVRLLRVEPGGVDLGRLEDLDELLDEVSAGPGPCGRARAPRRPRRGGSSLVRPAAPRPRARGGRCGGLLRRVAAGRAAVLRLGTR